MADRGCESLYKMANGILVVVLSISSLKIELVEMNQEWRFDGEIPDQCSSDRRLRNTLDYEINVHSLR